MSWLEDLKREDGGEPPDGEHTAWLERAVLRDTRNGTAIKCEWRTTDLAFYWESWHNTTGGGKTNTQQLLRDLEIDLSGVSSEDQLADELAAREDRAYIVRVSRSKDGRFINTAVVERSVGVQEQLNGSGADAQKASDIPADVLDLPDATPAGATAGLFDDDDIPF